MRRHRFRFARPRSGFALLITIVLVAFLVLVLVALASLTRVETQVAANGQQLSQARQNALLALNVALGQLQKHAGPDQRITAGAGLVAGVSNPHYTGVWDSTVANPSAASPLVWLVSGNEAAPVAVSPAVAIPDPADGNDSVWMLENSVETAARVKVRKQAIEAGNVPGFAPDDPQTVGHYAYWVSDEGVKARADLVDPWNTSTATADERAYAFAIAQRTGVEGVSASGLDTSTADKLAAAYPVADAAFNTALPKLVSLAQLPFAGADPVAQTALGLAVRNRPHDLTIHSRSVLADVALGGLKKDLTAWLAAPDSPTNPPRDTDYIADAATYMPRWSQIRSYAGIVADGSPKPPSVQNAEALPTTPVANAIAAPKQGIYPVITYARIGYNVSCAGPGQPIAFHLFPVVTLWNPHNVPIAAHDYQMEFNDQDYFNAIVVGKQLNPADNQRVSSYDKYHGAYSDAFATGYFAYSTVNAAGVPVGAKKPLRFRLKMSEPLAPGQSLVFTLSTTGDYQVDGNGKGVNEMEAHAPNRSDNSVKLYGPVMTETDLESRYFMSNTGGQQQLSLRDDADPTQVYHWIQNPTSLARFSSTPVNSSFLIQHPDFLVAPLIYVRTGLYQSQGQNGPLGNPSAWYAANSRWLALFNPLAPHSLRLGGGKTNSHSYYMDTQGITNPGPTFGAGNRASIGPGEDVSSPAGDLVVHEFLKPGVPLFSLAQLQHANVSQMTHYPAYAIGNSLAAVYVPRAQTVYTVGAGASATPTASPQQLPFRNLTKIHDLSYVLNRALWDKYFFSTVPASLTAPAQITPAYKLPNSRHAFHWKDNATTPTAAEFANLKTPRAAAAHLLVNGGFNVNSTSVQAWRALLYSRNGIATDPADAATYTHPYARYADPASGVSNSTPWQGYRVLSDAQIDNLAVKIVEQVRLRGPFRSLGDFVNRRLVDAPDPTGLKGALQAAIDAVDADSALAAADRINARAPFTDASSRIAVQPAAANAIPKQADTDVIRAHWIGSDNDADADKPHTSRAAFAPGYLSQADLLTSIGPVLAARSDTFTIRAYGDVKNPSSGALDGRAWCEAVVQRMPEYMDDTVDAWADPATLSGLNADFGRRFRVVSFRWLSDNDI